MNSGLALRDIELPEAVAWWPPAPGWWVLIAAVVAAVAALIVYARRRRQRARVRRATLLAIDTLRSRHDGAQDLLVADLSSLLRRACISSFPRESVAGLTGERWLAFLDEVAASRTDTAARRPFVDGPGRALLTAPYCPGAPVDAAALLDAATAVARALPDIGSRAA